MGGSRLPPDHELLIECRRSLHLHAVDARRQGISASGWERWARVKAAGLVAVIGDHELECLIGMVWSLRHHDS